jgi:hypothetical protein
MIEYQKEEFKQNVNANNIRSNILKYSLSIVNARNLKEKDPNIFKYSSNKNSKSPIRKFILETIF